MKTKESIKKYNKEYFARPDVIARAKIRNAKYRLRRKMYKKTELGRANNNKYRRKRYKEVDFKSRIKRTYGITFEQYQELVSKQKGICVICGRDKQRLHIDHCHKKGNVRGLLCTACNMGLGLFKDDENLLIKAIKYLKNNGVH